MTRIQALFLLLHVTCSVHFGCCAVREQVSEPPYFVGGGIIPPNSNLDLDESTAGSNPAEAKNAVWTANGDSPIDIPKGVGVDLKIFCWPGLQKSVSRLFYTACILLNISDESFHLYKGESEEEVKHQFESSSRWLALLPWRDRVIRLNGFSPTCLGVYTSEPYSVQLRVWNVDPYRMAMFVGGMVLLMFARKMSRNVVFHYSSGISVALLGSLLLAVFLISRLIPRKTVGVTFLVGGWAVVLYFLQTIWTNFREMLIEHLNYVIGYFISVSVVSFLLIYRFGGIHNPKTMDIIQWGLQLTGASLIYFSCTIESAGISLALGLLLLDVLTNSRNGFQRLTFLSRFFPPKPRKLLTKEEYEETGRRETQKELEKLRQHVQSPDCKSWHLVTKLKTPIRFAEFVEKGTHLTPDEVDSHSRDVAWDDSDTEEDSSSSFVPPHRSFASKPNVKNSASRSGNGLSTSSNFTDDEDDDKLPDYDEEYEGMDYS